MIYKRTVLFFLFFSIFFPQIESISSNVTLGQDSNPMKLSKDELDESNNDLFMDKYNTSSSYIKLYTKIHSSFSLFKRKTKADFAFKINSFIDLDEKSNYGIYLKLKQPIGNYQYIKFDYTFIPDIFLREYDDGDYVYQYFDFIQDVSYQCYFNLSKYSIQYQRPLANRKNKISFILNQETQFYNKYFTEFDLEINSFKILYTKKNKNNNYSFSYEYSFADNLTLFDGNVSTSFMDRGYDERKMSLSYSRKFDDFSIGGSINMADRSYSSTIPQDNLHLDRNHDDGKLSVWIKFKFNDLSQKIIFSNRTRNTNSPENWVEELKTFDRSDLSYTVYFKKISLGKRK